MSNEPQYRPSLKRLFRKWLIDVYEHLGLVLLFSFITAAVLSGAAWVIQSAAARLPALWLTAAVAVSALALSPLAVGIFIAADKIVYREGVEMADILCGYSCLLKTAIGLAAVNMVIGCVLAADVTILIALARTRPTFLIPMAIAAYAFLFWLATLLYQLPILVRQRKGIWSAIRKSVLLVLDNPSFTLVAFFAMILFTVLCALPAFLGMPLVYFGAASLLCVRAVRELLPKYGLAEEEREPSPPVEDNWRLPTEN